MMPNPASPPGAFANYPAPPSPAAASDEAIRELTMAWTCLAAARGSRNCEWRVTVLRPFTF